MKTTEFILVLNVSTGEVLQAMCTAEKNKLLLLTGEAFPTWEAEPGSSCLFIPLEAYADRSSQYILTDIYIYVFVYLFFFLLLWVQTRQAILLQINPKGILKNTGK